MSVFWKQIEGPLHQMKGNDRVVAYVTTRDTSWSQFNFFAPDWWWRVDIDGQPVVTGLVDERFEEVIDSAYQMAILRAEEALDRTIQALDKNSVV